MENTNTMESQNNNVPKKRKCNKKYLKFSETKSESLRTCGILLINSTLKMLSQANQRKLMDEMLHSIFFLGYIHESRLLPEKFFQVATTIEELKSIFPEPFEKYNSHLPTRTPFSVLLSMMEKLHRTEEKIKEELKLFLEKLHFPYPLHKPGNKNEQHYTLEATVICVCFVSEPQKYYGASLSCRGETAKRILIDLSCLGTWHEYVAHAVMSFYQQEGSGDSINFPQSVKCQAYYRDWSEKVYKTRDPCSNCKNLFNLPNAETNRNDFPYGNCAETECLSKLLFNDLVIQEKTEINNHTEENLEFLRCVTKNRLIKHLKQVGINVNEILFYKPA